MRRARISFFGLLLATGIAAPVAAAPIDPRLTQVLQWRELGPFRAGWASVIVSIWLLGGHTIFSLGLIGIYLSKVFTETKRRPYTVIRELYGARAAALRQRSDVHDAA